MTILVYIVLQNSIHVSDLSMFMYNSTCMPVYKILVRSKQTLMESPKTTKRPAAISFMEANLDEVRMFWSPDGIPKVCPSQSDDKRKLFPGLLDTIHCVLPNCTREQNDSDSAT